MHPWCKNWMAWLLDWVCSVLGGRFWAGTSCQKQTLLTSLDSSYKRHWPTLISMPRKAADKIQKKFDEPLATFFWDAEIAVSMSSLLSCLRQFFSAVHFGASREKNSQVEVTVKCHTVCLFIFIWAKICKIWSSLREAVSTLFCCCKKSLAESWVPGVWVRRRQRVWLELSVKRCADEYWRPCEETGFCWREMESEWNWGEVETGQALRSAMWAVKERTEMFSSVEPPTPARAGRPLCARKRSGEVPRGNPYLGCLLLLKNGASS